MGLKSRQVVQLLELASTPKNNNSSMMRYTEDAHTIFLRVGLEVHMVELKTMRHKDIYTERNDECTYHPSMSFYSKVEGNYFFISKLQHSEIVTLNFRMQTHQRMICVVVITFSINVLLLHCLQLNHMNP